MIAAENSGASVPGTGVSRNSSPTNSPTKDGTLNARASSSANAAMSGETVSVTGINTLPAGKSVTIKFNATIATGFTGTAITNQASISGSNFSTVTSNNLSTPVIQAPNFTKAFNPTTIVTNTGVSTLTFTLANPNPSQQLTNVAFNDSLPSGVQVAAVPGATTSGCGAATFAPAAAATSLSFSTGTIAAGSTCTVSVSVRSTTEGAKLNTSSTASSTQANASGTASATLNVINAPTFTKAFGAPSVALNGTTSLLFTITNTSATSGLSGISFTDTLPAGLVVATPNGLSTTCSGTPSATAGGGTVSLSGASLATSGSCTLTVNVTGTTVGAKNNSATLTTTELGANSAATGTVTLTVFAPPTVTKFFVNSLQGNTNNTSLNGTARLSIAITNPPGNAGSLSGLAITDTFPAGLQVDTTPAPTNTCGGTFAPSAGATNISLSGGGPLTVANQCVISVGGQSDDGGRNRQHHRQCFIDRRRHRRHGIGDAQRLRPRRRLRRPSEPA